MSTEWIVKYFCTPPLGKPVQVVDHFDNEAELYDFCTDNPDDVEQVIAIHHYPLRAEDVTARYAAYSAPSAFDREASRADRIRSERLEGVR